MFYDLGGDSIIGRQHCCGFADIASSSLAWKGANQRTSTSLTQDAQSIAHSETGGSAWGSGTATVVVTGTIVDKAGVQLGDLHAFLTKGTAAWEHLLAELGVKIEGSV